MDVTTLLNEEVEHAVRLLPRIGVAALGLIVAGAIASGARRGVRSMLTRGRLRGPHQQLVERSVFWAVILVGVAFALNVVGLGGLATGILAGGGLTAVVLGFAFREIGENLLAGILLAFSRPFEEGDVVESSGIRGVVRGIDLRTTHLRTSDGRDVFVPNAQIVNTPLSNFTLDGLRRPTFTVGVDYGDDVERARALLQERVAAVPGVLATPEVVVRTMELADSWVALEVAFWVDVKRDQEASLGAIRTAAMDAARRGLRDEGFTLSNDTTSNVVVSGALKSA